MERATENVSLQEKKLNPIFQLKMTLQVAVWFIKNATIAFSAKRFPNGLYKHL